MDQPDGTPFKADDPVPAIEWHYDEHRDEVNLLIRRPFYLNARIGAVQNAVWFGRSVRSHHGRSWTLFNWFPWPWSAYSRTLGRDSRATLFEQLRHHTQQLDILRHPDKAGLYEQSDED